MQIKIYADKNTLRGVIFKDAETSRSIRYLKKIIIDV